MMGALLQFELWFKKPRPNDDFPTAPPNELAPVSTHCLRFVPSAQVRRLDAK